MPANGRKPEEMRDACEKMVAELIWLVGGGLN